MNEKNRKKKLNGNEDENKNRSGTMCVLMKFNQKETHFHDFNKKKKDSWC